MYNFADTLVFFEDDGFLGHFFFQIFDAITPPDFCCNVPIVYDCCGDNYTLCKFMHNDKNIRGISYWLIFMVINHYD